MLKNQLIWDREVLQHYPKSLEGYCDSWLNALDSLSHYDLWQFDAQRRPAFSTLPKDLTDLLNNISSLLPNQYIPAKEGEYPSRAFWKISEKKRHEITQIIPLLSKMKDQDLSYVVDIGGGVGNLSRILASYHQFHCHVIERDKNFIASGLKKLEREPQTKNHGRLKFTHASFGDDSIEYTNEDILMGLHTCGPLALKCFQEFKRGPFQKLLNIGCCYFHLDHEKETNLSQFAKEHPIPFTGHSLMLASRGHEEMSYRDFTQKERVKHYRYAFHLYLLEQGIEDFLPVGDSPMREYWKSFGHYGQLKWKHLFPKKPLPDKEELNQFFYLIKTQRAIRRMFYANLIRWKFGRPLEFLLILDRLFFLQEQGHQVELSLIFDERLSPRNFALIGQK